MTRTKKKNDIFATVTFSLSERARMAIITIEQGHYHSQEELQNAIDTLKYFVEIHS